MGDALPSPRLLAWWPVASSSKVHATDGGGPPQHAPRQRCPSGPPPNLAGVTSPPKTAAREGALLGAKPAPGRANPQSAANSGKMESPDHNPRVGGSSPSSGIAARSGISAPSSLSWDECVPNMSRTCQQKTPLSGPKTWLQAVRRRGSFAPLMPCLLTRRRGHSRFAKGIGSSGS